MARSKHEESSRKRAFRRIDAKPFINWFGDWMNDPANASKVVDENGEPLVVYHGQLSELHQFHPNSKTRFNQTTTNGLRKKFYASVSRVHAKQFALGDEYFLSAKIDDLMNSKDFTSVRDKINPPV